MNGQETAQKAKNFPMFGLSMWRAGHVQDPAYLQTILFISLIFPFLPLVSLCLLGHFLFFRREEHPKVLFFFAFLLAVYLGMIDSTKVPVNDLADVYLPLFREVPKHDFRSYVFLQDREILFFVLNYVLYFVTHGSFPFYVGIVSTISYLVFFTAIVRFFDKREDSKNQTLFALILAGFWVQQFSLSAHLVRQFMATAFILLFCVERFFYGKNRWLLWIWAVLVHSSALFLGVLAFFNIFKRRPTLFMTFLMVLFTFLVFWGLPVVSTFIVSTFGETVLTYAFTRIANMNSFDLGQLVMSQLVFMGAMVLMAWVLSNSKKEEDHLGYGFYQLSNILTVLCAFIVANMSNTELAKRFFFMTFYFFPLVLPLFWDHFLFLRKDLAFLKYFVALGFVVCFFYALDRGVWTYAPTVEVLINPLLSYL